MIIDHFCDIWSWFYLHWLFGLLFSVDLVYPLLVLLLLVDVSYVQHVLTVTELSIIEGDIMPGRCGPDSEPPKLPIVLPANGLNLQGTVDSQHGRYFSCYSL
jgi:hypothetical protein